MVSSDCIGVPECNSKQFIALRQWLKLHKEIILQSDKNFKGVEYDPL
jgi:hypothetical protein